MSTRQPLANHLQCQIHYERLRLLNFKTALWIQGVLGLGMGKALNISDAIMKAHNEVRKIVEHSLASVY